MIDCSAAASAIGRIGAHYGMMGDLFRDINYTISHGLKRDVTVSDTHYTSRYVELSHVHVSLAAHVVTSRFPETTGTMLGTSTSPRYSSSQDSNNRLHPVVAMVH